MTLRVLTTLLSANLGRMVVTLISSVRFDGKTALLLFTDPSASFPDS